MNTISFKAIGNVTKSAIKSAKTAVHTAPKEITGGEKKMLASQDALSTQGQAMVKKSYVKPEMKVKEVKPSKMIASSGDDFGGPGEANNGSNSGENTPGAKSMWDIGDDLSNDVHSSDSWGDAW